MSSKGVQAFTDPSIRDCAQALVCEAMDDINRRVSCGDSFWVARTRVLEMHADSWVSSYGKACADVAVRGLHCLAPAEILDRETKRKQLQRRADLTMARLAHHDPGRNTALNRAWVRWFGVRLYVLALVALVTLQAAPQAFAGDSSAVGHPWRALALCGVSKPGPARERACRQFGAADRGNFRGYDFPAGTPRNYELPRSWELEPSDFLAGRR